MTATEEQKLSWREDDLRLETLVNEFKAWLDDHDDEYGHYWSVSESDSLWHNGEPEKATIVLNTYQPDTPRVDGDIPMADFTQVDIVMMYIRHVYTVKIQPDSA